MEKIETKVVKPETSFFENEMDNLIITAQEESLLDSKIKTRDTLFLKSIGVKNPENLTKIEIEPIVDIYSLVNYNEKNAAVTTNTQNFELLKLLAEEGDINKVIIQDLFFSMMQYFIQKDYLPNQHNVAWLAHVLGLFCLPKHCILRH